MKHWLTPLIRPHLGNVALGVTAVLVRTGAALAFPYLVKVAIDDGITPGRVSVLDTVALVYLGLSVLRFAAGRIEAVAVARAGQRTLHAVRTHLFAHIQRLSLDFHERERTGGVVARLTGDVEAMGAMVGGGLVTLMTSVLTLLGIGAVLLVLEWRLAVVALSVLPFVTLGAVWFRARSGPAWSEVRETGAAVTTRFQEVLTGAVTIMALRRQPAALADLAETNRDARRAHLRTVVNGAVFFPSLEFAGTVAAVVVIAYGAGHVAIGTLAAFLLYLRGLFGPIHELSEVYDTFQAANAGARRVGAVLAEEPGVPEPVDPLPLGPGDGEVRLEGVCFAYREHDVLHGIDITVPPGGTLALVGPTGAGKSTIAKLLLRFHDPRVGRVLLNGTDLRRLDPAHLRRAVAYVPQEPFLFAGTVADNLRFGRPSASDAELEAAVRAVGAWPAIEALPDGLDTETGERGARLATGERRLVALARAWLADPLLLVLDEATGNLPADTEARIQRALRTLRANRTTVLIAHRLSTVIDADLVAVVEQGRVVETGSPAALLGVSGRFADAYARSRP